MPWPLTFLFFYICGIIISSAGFYYLLTISLFGSEKIEKPLFPAIVLGIIWLPVLAAMFVILLDMYLKNDYWRRP